MEVHEGQENDSAFVVVVVAWVGSPSEVETTYRRGLSHADAMRIAEELEREGKVVRVMHETSSGRHEVDRYPLR